MIFDFLKRRAKPTPLEMLKQSVSSELHVPLDHAFEGNADAAQFVAIKAPAERVGDIVYAAFKSQMPNPAYAVLVKDVWCMNDHLIAQSVSGDRSLMRKIIAQAKFDCSALPDEFDLYRGVRLRHVPHHVTGISWTTNRDAACWFATRFSFNPMVIKSKARRSDAIFYSNERNEDEVILATDCLWVEDGDADDWHAAARRHMESLAEHNKRLRGG